MEREILNFTSCVEEFNIRKIKIKFYITNEIMRRFLTDFKNYEPHTLDWIERFQDGDIFYDLGASSGPFSLYAALKSNSKVISFEPSAHNYSLLDRNYYLNNKKIKYPVKLFNVALSNESGIGNLYVHSYESHGGRQLDQIVNRGNKKFPTIHIQTTIKEKLDNFIERYHLPIPNHIKIDVDGSEKRIILGAKKILKHSKLRSILIELDDEDKNKNQIIKMIENSGFTLYKKFQVTHFRNLNNHIFARNLNDA